jgi:hypothetical protein
MPRRVVAYLVQLDFTSLRAPVCSAQLELLRLLDPTRALTAALDSIHPAKLPSFALPVPPPPSQLPTDRLARSALLVHLQPLALDRALLAILASIPTLPQAGCASAALPRLSRPPTDLLASSVLLVLPHPLDLRVAHLAMEDHTLLCRLVWFACRAHLVHSHLPIGQRARCARLDTLPLSAELPTQTSALHAVALRTATLRQVDCVSRAPLDLFHQAPAPAAVLLAAVCAPRTLTRVVCPVSAAQI